MKRSGLAFVITALAAIVLCFESANSCAPEFPEAVFTRQRGPDKPLQEFVNGKIGIILPSWQRAYLTVAYRYYSGKPLHRSEQRSLAEFWDYNGEVDRPLETKPIDLWLRERAKYTKTPPPNSLSQFESLGYASVINCAPPAFHTAAQTLHDRAKRYDDGSADLQEWISGQDAVFHNCTEKASLPTELAQGTNPALRADRAYQIAAALFYRSDLTEARATFEAIATDGSSPWHDIAPYMVARTWIRQSEVEAPKGKDYNPEVLKKADPVLRAILRDPHQRSMHHDAQRLLALVRYHAYPQERLHELAALVANDRSGDDFGQNLRDYTMLLNRSLDQDPDFPGVEHWGQKYEQLKKVWRINRYKQLKQERRDDLGDWLVTFQSKSPQAKAHAVERWQHRASLPWLVLAVSKVSGSDSAAASLIAAADAIPEPSPAYPMLVYHRARLAKEQGRTADARNIITAALARRAEIPLSSLNLLEDELSQVTDSLDQFAKSLGRSPVELTSDCEGWEEGSIDKACAQRYFGADTPRGHTPLPQIDATSAFLMNTRIPVATYAKVALSPSIPENLRVKIIPTVWLRAALLDRPDVAASVARDAVTAEPRLQPYVEQYSQAQSNQEREFVAAFASLHFPGIRPFIVSTFERFEDNMKIDDYRDNWWCSDVGSHPEEINYYKQNQDWSRYPEPRPTLHADTPAFLAAEQKTKASAECKRLRALGLAQRSLPRIVLTWARQHPKDPRVPEALHYAERVVRYGCDDGKENRYGRDLFRMLHQNYPKSEWTKKTPLWYGMTLQSTSTSCSCGANTACETK